MTNEYAKKLGSVPKMKLNFSLGAFKLTLRHDGHDNYSGLQLYTKKFKVSTLLYDLTDKYNRLLSQSECC